MKCDWRPSLIEPRGNCGDVDIALGALLQVHRRLCSLDDVSLIHLPNHAVLLRKIRMEQLMRVHYALKYDVCTTARTICEI